MSQLATCPVCTTRIEIESDDAGNKVECGHCRSLHRVQDDLALKTLIESLDFEPVSQPARPAAAKAAAGPGPAAPKLVSRREKMREERAMALASGDGRRRTTNGRSRRV